jgi:hypothetical protein
MLAFANGPRIKRLEEGGVKLASRKTKRAKPRDPLPEHFESPEEAGKFWDTHDSGDYEEFMRDVEFNVRSIGTCKST